MRCTQPRKQFELHALGCLGCPHYLSHGIRPGRKVKFRDRLTRSTDIGINSLFKVPVEKSVWGSAGIIEQSAVKVLAGNVIGVGLEAHNFVVSLAELSQCRSP